MFQQCTQLHCMKWSAFKTLSRLKNKETTWKFVFRYMLMSNDDSKPLPWLRFVYCLQVKQSIHKTWCFLEIIHCDRCMFISSLLFLYFTQITDQSPNGLLCWRFSYTPGKHKKVPSGVFYFLKVKLYSDIQISKSVHLSSLTV